MDLEMRFSPPVNPATGLEPVGTVETLEATALVTELEPAVWCYQGDTQISWDTQRTKHDARGRILLVDETGASWWAEVGGLS